MIREREALWEHILLLTNCDLKCDLSRRFNRAFFSGNDIQELHSNHNWTVDISTVTRVKGCLREVSSVILVTLIECTQLYNSFGEAPKLLAPIPSSLQVLPQNSQLSLFDTRKSFVH